MATHTVKLLGHETIAEGTMAFTIERPTDFAFTAGQYLHLTLIDPPDTDAEGGSRDFSIASPPYETQTLMIAMRMRDTALKRTLGSMPIGSPLAIDGPMGGFTLHLNAEKPAVFLMGGIGITPVRSIALQAAHDKLPHRITIFYSNRRPEDAAFLDELQSLEKQNSNYRCIATMTEMDKSKKSWSGPTGFIDTTMLEHYIPNYRLSPIIYYISGPPAMVAAMRNTLNGAEVNDDNIRSEEFSGY